MTDRENPGISSQPPAAERDERSIPIVGEAVRKSSRFSREFVATMISLAAAAFGVVAALAWNTAITALLSVKMTLSGAPSAMGSHPGAPV